MFRRTIPGSVQARRQYSTPRENYMQTEARGCRTVDTPFVDSGTRVRHESHKPEGVGIPRAMIQAKVAG
jgi:hypothetical protein